jgi:F-type H+-transporting ATPase subunit b
MLVDWFTTAAQIVNFLILVWLLKRFLYKPILQAMDERERRMAKALKDAQTQKRNAENEQLSFESKLQELAEGKEHILKLAGQQAEQERKRMIAEARDEVAQLEAQWRDTIEREKEVFFEKLSGRIQSEVLALCRQVLSDLAGANLEACIAKRFAERLTSLDAGEKGRLAASLGNSSIAVITSTFEISESGRCEIEEAIRQNLGVTAEIQFLISPGLIAGIELRMNGRKIAWTIQDYLFSFQKELEEVMRTREFAHVG